jgi:hypothetical protein
MINLYRPSERSKPKTMFPVNKSHIASMNIRINCEGSEAAREPLRNTTNRLEAEGGSRSAHKYKKSLVLQETTIQLVKRSSDLYPKAKDIGLSTERFKEPPHKRSIDCGTNRIRTDLD